MDPERWKRLEPLFHRLLELPQPERAAAAAEAAGSDPGLAAELAGLLAAHEAPGPMDGLETAFGLSAESAGAESGDLGGRRIAHYDVQELSGRGGMGEVYRARDARLEREVALKVLPRWLGQDAAARQRLLTEARIVASLDHPNICTLLEIGETEDGRSFLVMPFYEGETLATRLARGRLPASAALGLAARVARGLAAAHQRGIIHRDIKPSNLLLTADGGVKILDFGVARLGESDLTRPGERPGTVRYMAPEQLAGQPVDARADLWALGAVLQEMLTGTFARELLPAASLPDEPGGIRKLVGALLEASPAARWPDAASLVVALERGLAPPGALRSVLRRRPRPALLALALLLITVLSLAALARARRATPVPRVAEAAQPGVAVLPFRAVGADLEFWHEGIVDLLSFNIEGAGELRKIDPQAVLTAWRRTASEEDPPSDRIAARAVAASTGARYAVTGSAVRHGDAVRLSAEVHDIATERVRGSVQVDGPADSVLALVDRLTLELIRQDLLPAGGRRSPVNLSRVTTTSLPALKAYLAGERNYRQSRWRAAVADFHRAVELDSTFARALFRLGSAYVWIENDGGQSTEYLARAARFADRLPERDALLLRGRAESDLDALVTLTERYPDDVDGWYHRGDLTFHMGGALLRPPREYRAALERAIAMAPYGEAYVHLLDDAFMRYDRERTDDLLRALEADALVRPCPGYHIVRQLLWGTAAERARAGTALDTITRDALRCAFITLATAPATVERMEVLDRPHLSDSVPAMVAQNTLFRVVHARTLRGQIQALRPVFARADSVPAARRDAARFAVMIHLSGFPDSVALQRAGRVLAEAPEPYDHFWLGAIAAREARWADLERAARNIELQERQDPDGRASRAEAALAPALRAYAALLRGDTQQLPELERLIGRARASGRSGQFPPMFLRYEVVRALLAQDRLAEAERWLESFYGYDFAHFVPAQFFLAQIRERTGRLAEARAHYRLVLEWWRDADPEFAPWRQQAGAALRRLESGTQPPIAR